MNCEFLDTDLVSSSDYAKVYHFELKIFIELEWQKAEIEPENLGEALFLIVK